MSDLRLENGAGPPGTAVLKLRASRWLAVLMLTPLLLVCLPPAQGPAHAASPARTPSTSPPRSSASGERVDAAAGLDDGGFERGRR